MRFKRTVVSAVALAALVGGLTACGDDDDDTGDDAAPAAEAVDLTVTASKTGDTYAFDIPAEIDGGLVNLTLTNTDQEPHEIALVSVDEGTTPEDVTAALLESEGGPIPDYITKTAGVGFAAPGQSVTASQDIPAGDYVYFCTFGEDEAVHYKNGMLGAVTVANEDGEGDLPDNVGTITAEDYTFTGEGLKAGTNKVKFENTGPDQIHHAQLFPIAEGSTFEEAAAFLASEELRERRRHHGARPRSGAGRRPDVGQGQLPGGLLHQRPSRRPAAHGPRSGWRSRHGEGARGRVADRLRKDSTRARRTFAGPSSRHPHSFREELRVPREDDLAWRDALHHEARPPLPSSCARSRSRPPRRGIST
jgi:plastocyanin